MKKMPPIEKVYEALTAIADGRVVMHDGYAAVVSSDGEKEYTVRYDGDRYSSDDNATFWRGYPGYPVIAVMMLQGKLPFSTEEADKWKDINWKALNTKYKNRYADAVREVETQRHIDASKAEKYAMAVMKTLEEMPIEIKRKI